MFSPQNSSHPSVSTLETMSVHEMEGGSQLLHRHNASGSDVLLDEQTNYVVLDNGIVQVTITKPGGIVSGIKYGGIDNLLEYNNKETNRGYWDMNWSQNGGQDNFYVVSGTDFHVVFKDANRVEVSFARLYDPEAAPPGVPLNIDKRFVLMRGSPGFYSYGIYEKLRGWPAFNLNQTRITFKLSNDKFHYMAIADERQRLMPRAEDLMPERSQQLAYPEAHLLTNPIEPDFKGEVDDKYQYSMENKELKVHGWVSNNPMVGFWIISPSFEFRNGGPMKQNLTSHVGPTCLSMFHSAHYAGIELCPGFEEGEAWKKVFGPVFIYLNSAPVGTSYPVLWGDARAQATTEIEAWPYLWPASLDFPKAKQRSSLCGQLLVSDKFQPPCTWAGKNAFLGLATPGEIGSWQTESKGYQFWTQADANGNFCIRNICSGVYDLFGWVPGIVGDYKFKNGPILIHPGAMVSLGKITYESPRDGPTVWEIGVPNRTATGFLVPDPNPKYVNKLYLNSNQKWRQYGLWERYTDLYPTNDLVYTVGQSDWRNDWFYAHLNRIMPDGSYAATTWEVRFGLAQVMSSPYKLRIATASAHGAALQVFVNEVGPMAKPVFDTMQYGKDNAVARHGIHGLYKLWTIDIPVKLLRVGQNSLFLKQRQTTGPFTAILYDYLRLEAPIVNPAAPMLQE